MGSQGKYAQAFDLGEHMAGVLLDQFVQEGSPLPFPQTPTEVATYVDRIAPGALEDIGTMMAQQSGSMIAVPKEAMEAVEQGFRTRMTQLVLRAIG